MSRHVIQADWPAPPGVKAMVTTRTGGFSQGPWASMNLGTNCGDDRADVLQNRDLLGRELPSDPLWLQQVHGVSVVVNDGLQVNVPQADAQVAFGPGRVCAVLTADCLPVLFCSRSGDRVGAAHAGWRGLADGVLEETIKALESEPSDLMAWLGPAIGPEAYEVGDDVVAHFAEEFPRGFRRSADRWLMNLYTLARIKLEAAGVTSIHGGLFCTWTEQQRFYSYRRDGVTGRMASLVWIE